MPLHNLYTCKQCDFESAAFIDNAEPVRIEVEQHLQENNEHVVIPAIRWIE